MIGNWVEDKEKGGVESRFFANKDINPFQLEPSILPQIPNALWYPGQ